jgi:hypothetical protein
VCVCVCVCVFVWKLMNSGNAATTTPQTKTKRYEKENQARDEIGPVKKKDLTTSEKVEDGETLYDAKKRHLRKRKSKVQFLKGSPEKKKGRREVEASRLKGDVINENPEKKKTPMRREGTTKEKGAARIGSVCWRTMDGEETNTHT